MIILAIIFGALVFIGLIGFLFPRKVHVERTLILDTSIEKVWTQVSELENFGLWNPWAKKDPNIEIEITGTGKGSKYKWKGNRSVGEGSLEITNLEQNRKVDMELLFGRNPNPATTSIILQSEGIKTKITWTMDTDMGNNPAGRYMGLFMDKFVGKDYEIGLENLRNVCENN
ncbi:MAG: SRPBCC family protein [Crocinitomicaceae bacterium]|nr:SRPBCC family protein [Crocinitomicaceae bacterium]